MLREVVWMVALMGWSVASVEGADARLRGIYTPGAGGEAGQWAVFAEITDATGPAVAGIGSLSVDVLGGGGRSVSGAGNVLPRGSASNGGEGYGFWLFNSNGTLAGGSAMEISGAQLMEFGTAAAERAKFEPLVLRGVGIRLGAVSAAAPYASATAWDAPVTVARGLYTGSAGTLTVQLTGGTELDLLVENGGDWSGPGNVIKAANVTRANAGVFEKAGTADANLDGQVDFSDLVALAQNYNQAGRNWFHGDFSYDGAVDFADLVLLAQNYNTPVAGEGIAAAFAATVPEPAGAGVIAMVVAGLIGQRRPARTANVLIASLALLAWMAPCARAAIIFGQLDNFQDGSTMEWSEGASSFNPPENVKDGGPGGAGDSFLRNESSGGGGAGSKQIMFNQAQWTGNYNAAGVARIEGQMANFGTTTLRMRFAVKGGLALEQYATTTAVVLPPDGVWRPVAFNLTPAAMTSITQGGDSLATVLADVKELRLLSSLFPNFQGDTIISILGVDDLRALRLPGDANFDGRVSFADFQSLERNFLKSGATWGDGDFNFDGTVDLGDFTILRGQFGASAALDAFAAAHGLEVPEPGGVGLLMGGLGVLGWIRRGGKRGN